MREPISPPQATRIPRELSQFLTGALCLKMREPSLSETPAAFQKIPNRSGSAGRKGGEGERNSRATLAFVPEGVLGKFFRFWLQSVYIYILLILFSNHAIGEDGTLIFDNQKRK